MCSTYIHVCAKTSEIYTSRFTDLITIIIIIITHQPPNFNQATHILRKEIPRLLESLYGGGAEGGRDLEDGDIIPQLTAVLGNGHQLLYQGTPLTGLVT